MKNARKKVSTEKKPDTNLTFNPEKFNFDGIDKHIKASIIRMKPLWESNKAFIEACEELKADLAFLQDILDSPQRVTTVVRLQTFTTTFNNG